MAQDCFKALKTGGKVLEAFDKAGVIDVLVATLEHDSPFCVAAAAGVLGWVGACRDGGQASLEASGAVPAPVCVVKRQTPARKCEMEDVVFCRLGTSMHPGIIIYLEGHSALQNGGV
jgi:hypothetical protein